MRTIIIEFLIAILGAFFGIIMYNSEAASFYRIHEMFRFESFHMYGIIGAAVVIGAIGIAWIKRQHWHDVDGEEAHLNDKQMTPTRYIIGGTMFGLGWGLVGACPGPQFVLLGAGYWSLAIVIAAGILGTFVYGLIRDWLPH